MPNAPPLPEWEQVLSSAAHLQRILPDAVLVRGTAVAAYVGHRTSTDADHVVTDLRDRFDAILAELESVAGWTTARVERPVLILGSLDGIETGIRQLIRSTPLETRQITVASGTITVPTEAEILRIKAILILRRNATRDYLDFIALTDHMGADAAEAALLTFDTLYPQINSESPTQQLVVQLSNPLPFDLAKTDLANYKGLDARWQDWGAVRSVAMDMGTMIFERLIKRRSSSI